MQRRLVLSSTTSRRLTQACVYRVVIPALSVGLGWLLLVHHSVQLTGTHRALVYTMGLRPLSDMMADVGRVWGPGVSMDGFHLPHSHQRPVVWRTEASGGSRVHGLFLQHAVTSLCERAEERAFEIASESVLCVTEVLGCLRALVNTSLQELPSTAASPGVNVTQLVQVTMAPALYIWDRGWSLEAMYRIFLRSLQPSAA